VHAPVPVAGSPGGADEGLRAVRLSAVGLGLTAAVQFAFVAASGSVALLADALHNLGDVFTTATLWIAFVVGRRQPDRDHTFGYARAEDVAGVLVVLAIAASAAVAAWESLDKLLGGEVPQLRRPSWALGAALVGVVGNEAVAQYKIRVGRRVNSVPLEADGRHSRVDGLASLAAALGIAAAWAGWPAADPLAGLLLSGVIVWVLVVSARDVLDRLLDRVDAGVSTRSSTRPPRCRAPRPSTRSVPAGSAAPCTSWSTPTSTRTCPCVMPTRSASGSAMPSSTPCPASPRSTCTWTRPGSTTMTATVRRCTTRLRGAPPPASPPDRWHRRSKEAGAMLTEVVVELEDRIGALADLGELLGGHGVDIRALAVLTVAGGRALAHLVVEPADVAVRVLREHDLVPERVREVLSVTLEDEPGALGRYCRKLADASINLEAVYLAGERNGAKELVLAVSDLQAARRLRGQGRR